MQDESLFGLAFEAFEALHVVAGAEGGGNQGLGFAAGEDGAAVGAGQDSGFDPDVADFVEGAGIGTAFLSRSLPRGRCVRAEFRIVLQLRLRFFVILGNFGLQLFLELFDQRVAFRLGMLLGIQAVGQLGADFLSSARRKYS